MLAGSVGVMLLACQSSNGCSGAIDGGMKSICVVARGIVM